MGIAKSYRELNVYRNAFEASMEVVSLAERFPQSEKFELTSQVRRSSRSICANLAEAWRKRRYKKHFISKLSDCASEADETRVWLEFALASDYISREQFDLLDDKYDHVLAQLTLMQSKADQWVVGSA